MLPLALTDMIRTSESVAAKVPELWAKVGGGRSRVAGSGRQMGPRASSGSAGAGAPAAEAEGAVVEEVRYATISLPVRGGQSFEHSVDEQRLTFTAPAGDEAGLSLLLLDAPHLYDREGGPYSGSHGDWTDNAQRFAALGWVAARIARDGLADGVMQFAVKVLEVLFGIRVVHPALGWLGRQPCRVGFGRRARRVAGRARRHHPA